MYEIPQLALDDASGKDSQARDENVIISSSPAYGHFQISRQEHDTKEDKEGKGLDQTYEIPHLSARYDTTVKANPARSENVITSSNQHMDTSRSLDRRMTEKKKRKGRNGSTPMNPYLDNKICFLRQRKLLKT